MTTDNSFQQQKALQLQDLLKRLPFQLTGRQIIRDPTTDSIRTILLQFQDEENSLLSSREAAAHQSRVALKAAIITLLVVVLALLLAGSYIVFYNFNRRIAAEKGRQESEGVLGLLINHVKDYAIIMLDAEGKVLSWNKGAQQMKGYSREEILGQPISVFYTDEENARGEAALNLQMAAQDGRHESLGLRRRKDGSEFYADVVFTAMRNEQEELTGFIKITRDITAQVTAQDDLNKSLAREKELNELKSRFVTLASHEFKTPLTVIQSSTTLLEKYQSPDMADRRLRHIHRIRSNVNNLKQLLNDFLSLEKLEGGIVRNAPAVNDVVLIAQEAVQDMEEACKEGQHIAFEVRGTRRLVAVDEHLLRNVLNNLLSNASKYSPEQTPIRFLLEFDQDKIRFSVTDKGIGIPPEDQEHLFERFFRASNTLGVSGTGLGLNIVKKYLDLMGGTIEVTSKAGAGSTFTVMLPALPDLHDHEATCISDGGRLK